MCAGRCREPRCIRSPGHGSQRLPRALGGTRILLAAAPTTPPCFCRWQRSSLLLFTFTRSVSLTSSQNKNLSVLVYVEAFSPPDYSAGLTSCACRFFKAPWQGFEKAERCPSLASLFPPQAAVGSAAVRIHPCIPFFKADKTETPVPIGYRSPWWARVDFASRAAKNSPLGCFCAVFCDSAAAVRIHPLYESSLVTKQKPQRTCIR